MSPAKERADAQPLLLQEMLNADIGELLCYMIQGHEMG